MSHWREFVPSKYLCGADLRGRRMTLMVDRVVREKGQEGDAIGVMYFKGAKKGLRLNVEICRVIEALYGEDVGGWLGRPLTLYPTRTKAFGRVELVVRVAAPEGAPGVVEGAGVESDETQSDQVEEDSAG